MHFHYGFLPSLVWAIITGAVIGLTMRWASAVFRCTTDTPFTMFIINFVGYLALLLSLMMVF